MFCSHLLSLLIMDGVDSDLGFDYGDLVGVLKMGLREQLPPVQEHLVSATAGSNAARLHSLIAVDAKRRILGVLRDVHMLKWKVVIEIEPLTIEWIGKNTCISFKNGLHIMIPLIDIFLSFTLHGIKS